MKFLTEFNPSRQIDIAANVNNAIFGNYPSLADVAKHYSDNTPTAWLVGQLVDLSEFCGCKDKITTDQLKACAQLIRQEFYFLKLSELMLFFRSMKTGKYGHFYGSVDPQRIMSSLRDFVSERNSIIDREESRIKQERNEIERRETEDAWAQYGSVDEFNALREQGLSIGDALNALRKKYNVKN